MEGRKEKEREGGRGNSRRFAILELMVSFHKGWKEVRLKRDVDGGKEKDSE